MLYSIRHKAVRETTSDVSGAGGASDARYLQPSSCIDCSFTVSSGMMCCLLYCTTKTGVH